MRQTFAIAALLLAAVAVSAADVPVAPRQTGPSAEANPAPLIVAAGADFVVIWEPAGQPRFALIRHSDEVLFTGDFGRPGLVAGAITGPNGSALVAFNDGEAFASPPSPAMVRWACRRSWRRRS